MSINTFDPSELASQPISVTQAAADFFKKALDKHECASMRLSTKKSGCSGHSYVLEPDVSQDGDELVTLTNGVSLAIDPEALGLIQGTEIDLEVKGLNGTIVFRNPNVVSECGCGESFSVDSDLP